MASTNNENLSKEVRKILNQKINNILTDAISAGTFSSGVTTNIVNRIFGADFIQDIISTADPNNADTFDDAKDLLNEKNEILSEAINDTSSELNDFKYNLNQINSDINTQLGIINSTGTTATQKADAQTKLTTLLTDKGTTESEIRTRDGKLKTLIKQKKELDKTQKEITKEIIKQNKGLAEQAKISKKIQDIWNAITGVLAIAGNKWLEIDKAAKSTAKSVGLSKTESVAYHKALAQTTKELAYSYGLNIEQANKLQNSYSDMTGKAKILTAEQMGHVAALDSLIPEATARMLENMDKLGSDTEAATGSLAKAYSTASKLGLNASKTSQEFAKNLSMANRFTFKNGVDGIMRMTMLSQRLKFNLESMGSMIEQFETIDGAITTSANLQVLGGSYAANFANPLESLSMSLMNPEGLIEKFENMIKGKGTFNKETGMVEVSAIDRQFLKHAAKGLGLNFDEVMTSVNQSVRNKEVEAQMQSNITNEDMKTLLMNKAQFNKNGEAYISVFDKEQNKYVEKNISEISSNDPILAQLAKEEEPVQDIRENVELLAQKLVPLSDKWKAIKEQRDIAYSQVVDGPMRAIESLTDWFANSPLWKILVAGNPVTMAFMGAHMALKASGISSGGIGDLLGGLKKNGIGGTARNVGSAIGNYAKNGINRSGFVKGGAMAIGSFGLDWAKDNFTEEGSTVNKLMDIGSTALGWAGTGAMIGSLIPVIGTTIGGALGGLAGTLYGIANNFMGDKNTTNATVDPNPHAEGRINLPSDSPLAKAYNEEKGASGNNARVGVFNTNESIVDNKTLMDIVKIKSDLTTNTATAISSAANSDIDTLTTLTNSLIKTVDSFATYVSSNTVNNITKSNISQDNISTTTDNSSIVKPLNKSISSVTEGNISNSVDNSSIVQPLNKSISSVTEGNISNSIDNSNIVQPIATVGTKTPIIPVVNHSVETPSFNSDINLNINGTLKLDASSISNKSMNIDLMQIFNDPKVKQQLIDIIKNELITVNGRVIRDSRFNKLGNIANL